MVASQLKAQNTVIAFDWRGHGDNVREDESDMSTQTLIQDAVEVLAYVHEKYPSRTMLVLGHSMGGAIAVKTIDYVEKVMADSELKKAILGCVIIDVVEGTAMEALPFME